MGTIDDLRTFDVVRPREWSSNAFKRGYVLVMLPGEPERVIVTWKGHKRVELVENLVVLRRAK